MADIRHYIKDNLLDPLKYYPTTIQDTILELIIEKLETLYAYTVAFPEIVSPTSNRLDILKVIADQFLFTIRDNADIQEQIDILDNILTVYNRRGSIDTIENMWKYYGGDLPKEVQVIIPSYSIFRYNISPFSGTHVFPDSDRARDGVYEIRLSNTNYDIPTLKEFLIKELVAAGNYIYFTNAVTSAITERFSKSYYKYDIVEDNLLHLQLTIRENSSGVILSGPSHLSLSGSYNLLDDNIVETLWSGKENIFVEVTNISEAYANYEYIVREELNLIIAQLVDHRMKPDMTTDLHINSMLYCTPEESTVYIMRDLYNDQGEHFREKVFTLGDSLLGEPLGYERI